MPKSPENMNFEKPRGEVDAEKELRLDISEAEESLLLNARKKSELSEEQLREHPVRFSPEDSAAIYRSWEKLDPEMRDLAKAAFPKLAAWLLAKKIEQKQFPTSRLNKKGWWEGEGTI